MPPGTAGMSLSLSLDYNSRAVPLQRMAGLVSSGRLVVEWIADDRALSAAEKS
jgi:hypothetical protein